MALLLKSAALAAGLAAAASATLESDCKQGLEVLQGQSDVELAARCRASFSPDLCREARSALGGQPWSSMRIQESCKRFAAAVPRDQPRGLEAALKHKSKAPTPPPLEEAAQGKSDVASRHYAAVRKLPKGIVGDVLQKMKGGEADTAEGKEEGATMAEEDEKEEVPKVRVMADTKTVEAVKKDEGEETDGEQTDSDEGEGEPDSKKGEESSKVAEADSLPVAETVEEAHKADEQETKELDADSKEEEDDADDDHEEEEESEMGAKASEHAEKPSSTVKADTEAAEETDKGTDETEIADGSTEPSVEVEAESDKEAGDEAKESELAEANTNDAVELAGWQRVRPGQQVSRMSLPAGAALFSAAMAALALSAFRGRRQSASRSQPWTPDAECDLLELAEADLLVE